MRTQKINMKNNSNALLRLGVGLASVLFASTAAASDDTARLTSPPLFIKAETSTSCRIVNASSRPARVRLQIMRAHTGAIPMDVGGISDCGPGPIPPGSTCSTYYKNNTGGGEATYCAVTAYGARAKELRAVYQINGNCGDTCETIVSVDAR
jgi:hypothetical protein